ncbi:hypothetical protein Aperf_G00000038034 [Anoplocephala perfoliata]
MLTIYGYVLTERLGKGTYGEVFKAVSQKNRRAYAVKRIYKKSLCKRAQDNLVGEIGILKKLNHRNIVSMIDFTWDSEYVYIFMEYLGGGDLSSFLKTERRLSERTIRYFLQQLAFALHYLHERNIVHMDIKPQNILLTTSTPPVLKLADFGFATSLEETVKMNEVRGSLLYLAPEIYKYGVYDKSCDLWSVGTILFQCLFGKAPFCCSTIEGVKAKLLDDSPISIPEHPTYSKDCIDLLSKLLKRSPSERIKHEQFFVHPFIDLSHAPCPQSIEKALNHITLADSLFEGGDLFDAYVNYKEGLTHLISALQIESNSSRRQIMRSKLSHYIKLAENLNSMLDSAELENSDQSRNRESVVIAPDAVRYKAKGATLPVKPDRPPPPSSIALKSQTTRPKKSPPASLLPSVKPTHVPLVSLVNNAKPENAKTKPTASSSAYLGDLLANWFGFNPCSKEDESLPSQTKTSAPSPQSGTSSLEGASSLPEPSPPPVKTAHEYAIERLEALKSLSTNENSSLLQLLSDLQHYYTLLNNNEYKSAMDHIQRNFDDWISVVKVFKNAELSKTLRSELSEALTSAEQLKAALKTNGQIAPVSDEESFFQSCMLM